MAKKGIGPVPAMSTLEQRQYRRLGGGVDLRPDAGYKKIVVEGGKILDQLDKVSRKIAGRKALSRSTPSGSQVSQEGGFPTYQYNVPPAIAGAEELLSIKTDLVSLKSDMKSVKDDISAIKTALETAEQPMEPPAFP